MRILAYILVGAAIGVLSGAFGVGGSSISTPALRLALGVPPLIALATPLPVTIPTAIAGGLVYHRRNLIDWEVVRWTSLFGVPAVVGGALTTTVVSGHWLMVLTGIVILGIGIRLGSSALAQSSLDAGYRTEAARPNIRVMGVIIGLTAGFLSGLLASGGGFMMVPAFVLLLGMSMHQAAGTSLICVAAFAIPGSITHWLLGHIDPLLMVSLGVAVIPASQLGAILSLRLKSSQVQLLFGIFLVVFATYFLYTEIT